MEVFNNTFQHSAVLPILETYVFFYKVHILNMNFAIFAKVYVGNVGLSSKSHDLHAIFTVVAINTKNVTPREKPHGATLNTFIIKMQQFTTLQNSVLNSNVNKGTVHECFEFQTDGLNQNKKLGTIQELILTVTEA